jgi:predicted  nucleic acid-binding Zn-ribbon protein
MANPNIPPDQPTSLSAAELRRRLLASTPPPIMATASTPDPIPMADFADDVVETPPTPAPETPAAAPPSSWNGTNDLLKRLRMPGKSGSVPVPTARPAAPPPVQPPAPVSRRTPSAGSRLYDANALAGAMGQFAPPSADDSPLAEVQRLKNENKELRKLLDEMKHLLQEASESEQQLAAKEKEFAAAMEAKDAQIEELNAHLGAIEEQIAKGELAPPPPTPKTRSELEEWGDDLEKESAKLAQDRRRLDEERRQLREDEEALEKQMREMEVCMARERALLARQETELKRLNAEIQHELEILQRGDAGLRDQMAKFQRRAAEVMTNKPAGAPPGRR